MANINTIERVRVYEHEPRALAQDKSKRRAARMRARVLKLIAIALIAAAIYLAFASLVTPAHADSVCNPQTWPPCNVNPAPVMELNYRSFIPIAPRQ